MDISNRSFASLMLNLEACERKLDSVLRKNSYGHLNKAGVSPDFRKNSDVYKWNFHYEINISWTFQIDPSLLWCLILRLVKGNLILLGGEFFYGHLNKAGGVAGFFPKFGLFQKEFSLWNKYFMHISNRSLASLMLHLEACERKLDSFLRKIS